MTEFAKYTNFIIFGDKHNGYTADIDIALIVESTTEFNKSIDEISIRKELSDLDYDSKLPLDINMIVIDKDMNNIIKYKKGGAVIQNIIYYTQHLHKQNYKISPILHPLPLYSITSKYWQYMLVIRYINKKLNIKECKLKDYESAFTILDKIDLDKIDKDIIKSLTMKMLQFYLYITKYEECYEKKLLCNKYSKLKKIDGNGILYLLTRGNEGDIKSKDIEFTDLVKVFKSYVYLIKKRK